MFQKNNLIWTAFLLSNFFYCIFAVFVVSKITILGDVDTYLYKSTSLNFLSFFNSTSFAIFFTQSLLKLLNEPLLVHFVFSFLSFLGIYIPLSKIPFKRSQLILMLMIFTFPSFGIWSNLIGKEALVIFSLGLVIYNLYFYYAYNKFRYKLVLLFSLYIIAIIKPQFFLPIGSAFLIIYFRTYRYVNRILWVMLVFAIAISSAFLLLKDLVNDFAPNFWYFFSGGGSTRPNTWLNDYDFFIQAPIGMIVAFFGPKISEINNITNLITFIESSLIAIYVLYMLKCILLTKSRIKYFVVSVAFSLLFLIFLVHYPFGYFNAGSAIRYRANFLPLIIIVLNILLLIMKNKSNFIKNKLSND